MKFKFLILLLMLGISQGDSMQAEIQTSKGQIVIELEFEKTPMTVANFVGLAEGTIENSAKPVGEPYYNGIKFHRVLDDFMIQGGDPTGTGRGGPGYQFPDEFHPDLKHSGPGILSMANSGPGTNGSQFFITHKDTPWLDNKHTVFGHVVSGQKVVDAIAQDDIIESITIVRNGDAATNFNAADVFKVAQEEMNKLDHEKTKKLEEEMAELSKGATTTKSGLKYIITKEGTGEKPKNGDTVSVHYAGYLVNGQKFDSSYDKNKPIEFVLGSGRVIKGWDEGILLLNVGTKAKLIIPAELGWGQRGGGPIPPNAITIFDVELMGIQEHDHSHPHDHKHE